MIGLGSIPIFALAIIDTEKFLDYVPNNLQIDYILNMEKEKLLIFISLAVAIIFFIKNILLSLFIYFQGYVLKKIKIFAKASARPVFCRAPLKLERDPSKRITSSRIDR